MEDKKIQLKKVLEVQEKISPYYTGGLILISKDNKTLYCIYNNNQINIVDIKTSNIIDTISPVKKKKNIPEEQKF
jgi:aldehyde:ferredoxin oxidoreductase